MEGPIKQETFFTESWAGDEVLHVDRGNGNGSRYGTPPGTVYADGPRSQLHLRGKMYETTEGGLDLFITRDPPQEHPRFLLLPFLDLSAWSRPGVKTWREGGLEVASCQPPAPASGPAVSRNLKVTLWLDPERGFGPVRSEVEVDGKLTRRTVWDYRRFGRIWFPSEVQEFHTESGALVRDKLSIVHSASFDKARLPRSLSVRDLHIETGYDVLDTSEGRRKGYWDGNRVIAPPEYFEKLKAGKLTVGPTVRRIEQHMLEMREILTLTNSSKPPERTHVWAFDWEKLVSSFVQDNQLSPQQAFAAKAVLDRCLKEAHRHYVANHARFADVARVLNTLNPQCASQPASRDDLRAARQQRDRLLMRIREIRAQELEPGLNAILTTQQLHNGAPIRPHVPATQARNPGE